MADATIIDRARGDHTGLAFPAHVDALRADGPAFLTRAFRAEGMLDEDNAVTAITRLDPWTAGGTGVKALLSVAYAHDAPGLARDLFVKFSRNFADPVRDAGRLWMPPEVRLARLSRDPRFPVAVPRCWFADIDDRTMTGIMVNERIAYGEGAIEPHHPKCMDHELDDPPAHYRALVANLARLAGAHKAGRLGEAVARDFPFDAEALIARRPAVDLAVTSKRIGRLVEFIRRYPRLFPASIADRGFLDAFRSDALVAAAKTAELLRLLHAAPTLIALCHMNANIDNAWFWRDPGGALRCGLIDWGGVGRMSVAGAIWGCLNAAEPDLHDRHLDELLALFATGYADAGGPTLDPGELRRHLGLHVALSALHMTTAPPAILREIPDPDSAADRYDPLFTANETARVQLKITVSLLALWARDDLGALVRSA